MTKIVIVLCFLYYVNGIVGSVPAPGHGALAGYCITNEHCDLGECCLSFTLPGENRTVDPGDITRFVKGKCNMLPGRNEGCIRPSRYFRNGNIYYVHCPCMYQYTCDGSGDTVLPNVGRLGYCRARCNSESDCAWDECCVEYKQASGLTSHRGLCQPMGVKGAECLQMNGSGRPKGIVKHSCPCKEQFTCGNIIRPITDIKQTAICGFHKG